MTAFLLIIIIAVVCPACMGSIAAAILGLIALGVLGFAALVLLIAGGWFGLGVVAVIVGVFFLVKNPQPPTDSSLEELMRSWARWNWLPRDLRDRLMAAGKLETVSDPIVRAEWRIMDADPNNAARQITEERIRRLGLMQLWESNLRRAA
jgi:hypothetical protein